MSIAFSELSTEAQERVRQQIHDAGVLELPETTQPPRAVKIVRSDKQLEDVSLYPVPAESELNGEYTRDPRLEMIVTGLLEKYDHPVAKDCTIIVLWRDRGGKSKGVPTLGKCVIPAGRERYLLREAHEADVMVLVSADHCRNMGITNHQMHALLWHELSHIGQTERPENADDAWEADLTVLPHDVEAFNSELALFGDWRIELTTLVDTVRQLKLDDLASL